MQENDGIKIIFTQMQFHIEEEISTINEILKENIISYDNDVIIFYLQLRNLFRNYKKDLKKMIKEIEQRKDKL